MPLHAQNLLDFIGDIEAPQGYDTILGNRQANLPVRLTQMTYGEIVDAQGNWGNKTWVRANWGHKTASSAAGRYQFMRKTLQDIAKAAGSIDGRTIFSSSLQGRLGSFLLLRCGCGFHRGPDQPRAVRAQPCKRVGKFSGVVRYQR
ncbi:hypothetical protein [Agrobacterium sp. NPDC089420]|uniref:hypothetical protein n=1 Tax=Agrobacterium sp. NPDC089420 TaxID=3363918 RepID=UPI00384D4F57